MSEHKEPIPSMVYNAAVGGHVTTSQQIIDENENKEQSQINSEVKEALGSGGSVDSRISAAVATETTRAQGVESTLQTNIDTETTRAQAAEATKANVSDVYTKSETYTKTEVNGLVDTPHQEYVTVATYASLPATGSADTIYRVSNYDGSQSRIDDTVYSEYAWDGSHYVFLCVKSQIGEVFDISVYHNNAKYTTLADALTAGVPKSLQKGGMSVKFVQSSDNKYVQYRLMSNAWSTTVSNWQGVDDKPTAGSDNLVKSGGLALQNYQHSFALIAGSTPEYNSQNKTFTLPQGTAIIHPNIKNGVISLSNDVVFDKSTAGATNCYLILNTDTLAVSYKEPTKYFNLSEREVVVALIRWDINKVYSGLFKEGYYKDGILTNVGSNDPNAVKQTYRGDFALITNGILSFSSLSPKSLTIPKDARIISPNFGIKVLSSSAVLYKPDNSWNTHYVVYDSQSNSLRVVQTDKVPQIRDTECLLCIIRWSDGCIISSNVSSYFVDGVEIDSSIPIQTKVNANLAFLKTKGFFEEKNLTSTSLVNGFWATNEEHNTPTFGTASQGWQCLNPILVKKGDVIVIRTLGGENARAYALTDTLKQIYERAPQSADYSVNPAYIYVSKDGYLYVNNKSVNTQFEVTVFNKEIQKTHRIYNTPINLKKENLRILDIGNSYTKDAHHYLPQIIAASGINSDYSLYKTLRGSASFKTWVDCYYDRDNYQNGYTVDKTAGNDIEGVATGHGNPNDGALFRTALANGNWDMIIIHQVSDYSNCYTWNSNGDDGYLKELIRILKKTNPNATIGSYLVASYPGDYVKNTEKSSLTRWQHIAAAIKEFMVDYGVDFIIPYGTSIQNLRASSLSDQYEFSTDGLHLADGIADYCAACTYYQMVFAPRFGVSILDNTWRKTDFDETEHGVKNINDKNAILAQKAAYCACYDMFEINNPDDLSI